MSGARDYSLTAADNINVGGVSIAEGMARSSVNNAMRSQLADIAELLLDFGGETITAGSGGAYAVSLPSAPTAYGDNLLFICRLNHDAGSGATINVNGLGGKDFRKQVAGVATALIPGDAPPGHRAICIYSTADDAVLMLNPALSVSGPAGIWLADPTSANLAAAVTDELGSPGQLMFSGVMDADTTLTANSDARVATQKATKSYVDAAVVGIHWAPSGPVAVATTANIVLNAEQTIDGVLTSNDRVLVKDQTAPAENGIWISAVGAWTRALDANAGSEMVNLGVFVDDGATQIGSQWRCTSTTAPTLGTDPIVFAKIGSTSVYSAGVGLQLTGTTFSIADDELLALGSVASAADRVPYFTGLGTATHATFTAAGRSLVSGADSEAQRVWLGVGAAQSPRFGEVNIGDAADTTIGRVSGGGQISVEGNTVYQVGGVDVAVADGGTGASTAAAARINLGLGTGDTPQFVSIQLGHATDTTLTRASAGKLAVEGNTVAMLATQNAFTDTQSIDKTNPGSRGFGLFIENRSTTPGTSAIIDFAPNLSGIDVRSAQIAAVNVDASKTKLVLRTCYNAAPVDALTVSELGAIRLHGATYATSGAVTTDSSGNLAVAALDNSSYTPGIVSGTNIDSTSNSTGYYIRVGSTVQVMGSVDIDCTAAALTPSTIGITLPFASNFSSGDHLRGFFAANSFPQTGASVIVADVANDRATVNFPASSTGSIAYSYSFMYRII